jgi:hypothetical protein
MPIIKPLPKPLPVYIPDQATIDAIKAKIQATALNSNTLETAEQLDPIVKTFDRQVLKQEILNIQSAMDTYILARQAEIDERVALISLCEDNGIFDLMPTPEGVSGIDATVFGGKDGQIVGVDTTMEFRNENDVTYTPIIASEITGLSAGTYFVRAKSTSDLQASGDVQIIINEPAQTSADVIF